MKRLIWLLLLGSAFGQGFFYSLPQPYPNTTITVCPLGAVRPCPSPSSIFNDAALTSAVLNPSNIGPGGQFGFYAASGEYTVQMGSPTNQTFNISLGGGGATVSPLTTKGDLFTFSTVNARFGVGSNGQCLTAQSGQATGLLWAACGAAPAFSAITSGTNTAAAMVLDSGSSLAATGTGTIAATGAPFSGLGSSTNSAAAMVCGTGCSISTSGTGTITATLPIAGPTIKIVNTGLANWISMDKLATTPSVGADDGGLSVGTFLATTFIQSLAGFQSDTVAAITSVSSPKYSSTGTKFTTNSGCTDSGLIGGASAGRFTSGATLTCTDIITIGGGLTSPNGWACSVTDLTTTAAVWRQTASSSSTVTIQATGGAVAADVISFFCIGY